MNVGNMLTHAWKMLGEPSDLDPDTTQGRIDLLTGLNLAIKAVASWKDPVRGYFFNYNKFRKEIFKKYTPLTGTAGSGSDEYEVDIDDLPNGETDISGSIISVNDENRLVYDNSGTTLYVHPGFSDTTSNEEYTLYPRWLFIDSTDFIEVLKVEDYDQGVAISNADAKDVYLNRLPDIGNPGRFYRVGNRIYFDQPPEDETLFRLWVFRLPKTVSEDTETPELPESVHYGIILWTVYWGYQWKQEPRDAYAAQERFKNYMRSVKSEYDVKDEMRDEFSLSIRVE